MSAHLILGLEQVPRVSAVRRFKEVRELGSERRETVWSLSSVGAGKLSESCP